MGRESKRVPLDFDWPLGKVWEGYLLPDIYHGAECPGLTCANGYSQEGAWLQKVAYVLAGSADDAREVERGRPLHPWLEALNGISYGDGAARPGSRFGELVDGLVEPRDGDSMFGHDVHRVWSGLRRKAGLPEGWGICETCKGEGRVEVYAGQFADAEKWESVEPPTGDGWQMWDTTSEGSPSSPVFATADALAAWCESGTTVFGHTKITKAQWLRIIVGDDLAMVEIAPGVVVM